MSEPKMAGVRKIIGDLYDVINRMHQLERLPILNNFEKRVYSEFTKCWSRGVELATYQTFKHDFGNNQKVKVVVPNTVGFDEIGSTSLKKFLIKFGDRTM